MKKILCIGGVTADIIVSPVDSVPEPGTLRAVQSTSMHVGGCAANAAIDLAKLGIRPVLCCKVGKDSFGEFVLKQTESAGVDTSGIICSPDIATTTSVVCVSSEGERSFLYTPGSTAALHAQDIPLHLIDRCDIVFVAGAMLLSEFDGEPCRRILEYGRSKGKFTVMDTAWDFDDVWLPKIEPVLAALDLFMPSYEEAVHLSGKTDPAEIADFLIGKGVKNVIIKLGNQGAYFCPEGEEGFVLPTYRKIKPVDTTGAGDSFCAGFLCGLTQGWNFQQSGAFANAVGTHCIQAIGASAGIRPIAEILKFMETTPLE
ncbi:MAG: carbohydrate kinase family protein [Ruthenibacterium sp.]